MPHGKNQCDLSQGKNVGTYVLFSPKISKFNWTVEDNEA